MAKYKGFTLIELLVVIAIIGILSSVVLASLNSARLKARDSRRVADIKQIQVAEELYYDATGHYSDTVLQLVGSANGQSLPFEPKDPSTGASYKYAYQGASGAATAYHLGAVMEQPMAATTLVNYDADFDSTVAGWTNGFNGKDTADPWIYDVRS